MRACMILTAMAALAMVPLSACGSSAEKASSEALQGTWICLIKPRMNPLFDPGYRPEDLEVQVSELLVATADESDELIDRSISDVLRLLRDRMKMDVVFVSQFAEGQRVIRYVDTDPGNPLLSVGDADPLEVSWCQRVVDGRLPEFIPDARRLPASAMRSCPPCASITARSSG